VQNEVNDRSVGENALKHYMVYRLLLIGICFSSTCISQGCFAEQPATDSDTESKRELDKTGEQKIRKSSLTSEQIRQLLESNEDPLRQYAVDGSPENSRVGEDWAKFLGPRRNGVSGETGLLDSWPEEGPPVVWEMETGTGYSAPSVRGNSLVLHHRIKNEEVVECFAADSGKPLWKTGYPSHFRDPYGYNNGPRCSPVLSETHCYTYGAEGKLLCVDLKTGKQVWMVETAKKWQIPEAFFGVGSTPLLVGKVLLVMIGGTPNGGIVAFHAETGEVLWEAVTKESLKAPDGSPNLDEKIASYSTMMIAPIHGRELLLAFLRDGLVALDPVTGEEQFQYFFRSRSFESVNAATPLVIDNEILLSAAYRTGAVLLRVKESGKDFDVIWKNRNLETHWSTSVPLDGHVVGFSGRHENEAMFRCIDIKNGEIVWETDGLPRVEGKPAFGQIQDYYGRGSAILAEGKLIVLGEQGVLALVEADPQKFREISRVKFPKMVYPSWAAPILSRGRLYLRCEGYLMCLDLKKAAE